MKRFGCEDSYTCYLNSNSPSYQIVIDTTTLNLFHLPWIIPSSQFDDPPCILFVPLAVKRRHYSWLLLVMLRARHTTLSDMMTGPVCCKDSEMKGMIRFENSDPRVTGLVTFFDNERLSSESARNTIRLICRSRLRCWMLPTLTAWGSSAFRAMYGDIIVEHGVGNEGQSCLVASELGDFISWEMPHYYHSPTPGEMGFRRAPWPANYGHHFRDLKNMFPTSNSRVTFFYSRVH